MQQPACQKGFSATKPRPTKGRNAMLRWHDEGSKLRLFLGASPMRFKLRRLPRGEDEDVEDGAQACEAATHIAKERLLKRECRCFPASTTCMPVSARSCATNLRARRREGAACWNTPASPAEAGDPPRSDARRLRRCGGDLPTARGLERATHVPLRSRRSWALRPLRMEPSGRKRAAASGPPVSRLATPRAASPKTPGGSSSSPKPATSSAMVLSRARGRS